jgi:3-(3-hydroxy-phenyl)propionate hydroxylase
MSNANTRTQYDADVIIVGAGPVGLTTACALSYHGISCRVIEKRPQLSPYSRANNVWSRPQELLASIGIRDALAENSYRIKQVNTLFDGHPTKQVEVDRVESPYPEVLYSGQDVIETTLSKLVEERGGTIERGKEIVAIEQDDEGVEVTVATAAKADGTNDEDTQTERLRCRFLVGADGSHSFVRHALGLDFEPQQFEQRMNRQVDARLKWRRSADPDRLWFFLYHHGFCGIMPVWGGYHRLFFLEDDAGVPDRDPTLAEIQTKARAVTGDESLTLSDPIWLTHSRFQHGAAAHYARGRVFLAGDAGHYTLPIGGQGMNAGFHDAVGLAWRLAMTIAGEAGSAVLDSYDQERQGEHARLDDQQAKGFRNVVYRSKIVDAALNVAAEVIPDFGALLQGTDDLQQQSVHYPKSLLNEDHLGMKQLLHPNAPHAGDRAPDAEVIDIDGKTTNLFSYIYNPDGLTWGWSLLAFDGRQPDAGSQLLAALAEVAPWKYVCPRLVLSAPIEATVAASAVPILFDLDGRAHTAYALGNLPALILIRPDGHIAFRGAADQLELLDRYCRKVFRNTVVTEPTAR